MLLMCELPSVEGEQAGREGEEFGGVRERGEGRKQELGIREMKETSQLHYESRTTHVHDSSRLSVIWMGL